MNKELKIGLAFSGGGFRAAAFSLGVLTYLDRIKIEDKTVLEHVYVLSTVSGGTITGARYAIGKIRGETFIQIYLNIYKFLEKGNLVSDGLRRLVEEKHWNKLRSRGLITSFADLYDKQLFNGSQFEELMVDDPSFHLKHISFNATEFKTPLQFRFQWSERINSPRPEEKTRGIIGNSNCKVPECVAKGIRMGDIVAASSCFPGGFEPVNFPGDFIFSQEISDRIDFKSLNTIGLMDGGIVDNQGIEPLLLADNRINRNLFPEIQNDEYPQRAIDLIIVSDVSSPFMEQFIATIQKPINYWRRLTPLSILIINNLVFVCSIYGIITQYSFQVPSLLVFYTFLASITFTINFLVVFLIQKLRDIELIRHFKHPLRNLLNLKLGVYETMVVNRAKSIMKMVGEVFMKQLRRMHFNSLYRDKTWKNRLIMNAIYELIPGLGKINEKIKKNKISTTLVPSCKIQEVAEKAASMSTTLWFTEEELKPNCHEKSMLDTLIACGQFNICWNLLEYIEKLERNRENTNANHDLFIDSKNQLVKDWTKFQNEPYWLINILNKEL